MNMMRKIWVRIRCEPAFAAIFVITLALGVGANAALVMALAALLATTIPARRARRANLLALLRPQ